MKLRYVFLSCALLLFLLLTGCNKEECKKDADCAKEFFVGECVGGACVFTPAPGECGNSICDENENKCSCSQDCGTCQGKQGTLELACIQDQCLPMVPSQNPVVMTKELSNAGDKFMVTANFPQPFNFKRDIFKIKISLSSQSQYSSNIKITRIFLSGVTEDRRTVNIAEKEVNKFLWGFGSEIEEELRLGFPTSKLEGTMTNLLLKINYDYTVTFSSGTDQKTGTLQQRYTTIGFKWVNPDVVYPCPESCDDGNYGTVDLCGQETNFLCQHRPLPDACGNFMCDGNENKCSCPHDCGPCSGSAGTYVYYACSESDTCEVYSNPDIKVNPASLFDDRKLTLFHMQNNYNYNNPFNIKKDKFVLDVSIYDMSPQISKIKIVTVRLLEGNQEVASVDANKEFTSVGSSDTIEVSIPSIPVPEQEKSLTLGVWYTYTKDGNELLGNYKKPLGKIVLMNPTR